MKININDNIKFKLTKHGKKVLLDWVEDAFKLYEDDKICMDLKEVSKSFVNPIGNGYHEAQLWQFMNIFGEKIYNGAEPVIKNNAIILEEKPK